MRRYETIFILRPNSGEEEINRVVEYTKEIIASENGVIIELNKWGMKKLAYLIKKESLGYYVFFDYASEPAAVAEIERRYRIDDSVIKYMTVKTDDNIDETGAQAAIVAVSERVAKEAEEEVDDEDLDDDDVNDNDIDNDNEDDE